MQENAIQTKDTILELVQSLDSRNIVDCMEQGERIHDVLDLTMGLWAELNYAYKGAEIASWLLAVLRECEPHHTQLERFRTLCDHLEELRDNFNKLQNLWLSVR